MKTLITTQPEPMMRGGTVADRVKRLERAEKEIDNRIHMGRYGEVRRIHRLGLILTLAL